MSAVTFEVIGDPAAQGSKRSVGNNVFVETSKKLPAWRDSVATAARNVAVDAADALDVTHCADGSTPQAPTVDGEFDLSEALATWESNGSPPNEHPAIVLLRQERRTSHARFLKMRAEIDALNAAAPTVDSVPVPRAALDRLIGCHRFFCKSSTTPCCPAGEWIAAAGVSSDR